jgi:hypothetical protein
MLNRKWWRTPNGLLLSSLFMTEQGHLETCELKAKPFESVKNQIGFCGIWCGSCVAGNGALRELTKKYNEIIKNYGLEAWAPKDFDFKEFTKGLASIQAVPLCQGCLKGGGRPNCEMRTCASNKNIADCSECDQTEACKNSETLQKMRMGAQRAGLFIKTENVNRHELMEKWISELKGKWPHNIFFLRDK